MSSLGAIPPSLHLCGISSSPVLSYDPLTLDLLFDEGFQEPEIQLLRGAPEKEEASQ